MQYPVNLQVITASETDITNLFALNVFITYNYVNRRKIILKYETNS